MSAKAYIGKNNTAVQVKKMYIGKDDTAKTIKKIYMGINNLAQCIFGGKKEVVFWGYSTFGNSQKNCRGASNSKYAILGGGTDRNNSTRYTQHYYMDKQLTAGYFVCNRVWANANEVSDYALFVGGQNSAGTAQTTMTAIDSDLNQLTISNMGIAPRSEHNSENIKKEYAFFFYGKNCVVVDKDLQKIATITMITSNVNDGAQCSCSKVGNNVIYLTSDYTVSAIDETLTKNALENLPTNQLGCNKNGYVEKYAFFGGGNGNKAGDVTYGYDENLTRYIFDGIGYKYYAWSAYNNGYSLVGNGDDTDNTSKDNKRVDIFDEEMVHTILHNKSFSAGYGVLNIGKYILFCAGYYVSSQGTTFTTNNYNAYKID